MRDVMLAASVRAAADLDRARHRPPRSDPAARADDPRAAGPARATASPPGGMSRRPGSSPRRRSCPLRPGPGRPRRAGGYSCRTSLAFTQRNRRSWSGRHADRAVAVRARELAEHAHLLARQVAERDGRHRHHDTRTASADARWSRATGRTPRRRLAESAPPSASAPDR